MSLTPPITFPASLDEVKIKGLLNSAFYISSFISVEEEEYLISKARFDKLILLITKKRLTILQDLFSANIYMA